MDVGGHLLAIHEDPDDRIVLGHLVHLIVVDAEGRAGLALNETAGRLGVWSRDAVLGEG